MRSIQTIDVEASPELVFALVRDVERWPRLLPHYLTAQVQRPDGSRPAPLPDGPGAEAPRLVRYVALRAIAPWLGIGAPLVWRSWSWAEAGRRRLRFVHVGGPSDGMDVTWRIEPAGGGCRITIEHVLEPAPSVGRRRLLTGLVPRVVDRLAVRPVAWRTLESVRALAEAVSVGAGGERDDSR